MVNINTGAGGQLYQAYLRDFSIPENRRGVPAIVIGDQVMVGANEIPNRMPGIVGAGLSAGGLDWPLLTGLPEYLERPDVEYFAIGSAVERLTVQERFMLDPIANAISVVVLIGLLLSAYQMSMAYYNRKVELKPWPVWVIPALLALGFFVAGYMTYVETTQAEAVCGPVGDCNTVQQSEYATLFGFLPVGILGLFGFTLLLLSWVGYMKGNEAQKVMTSRAFWWLALGGTLFSAYLTFLEPFVIGASCAWCLTSAIIMALLLWAGTPLVKAAHRPPLRRKVVKGSKRHPA